MELSVAHRVRDSIKELLCTHFTEEKTGRLMELDGIGWIGFGR